MAEIPELHITATKIVRAFKPGDIVFIECPAAISQASETRLRDHFREYCPEIKVIILGDGLKVAGREEIVEINASSVNA